MPSADFLVEFHLDLQQAERALAKFEADARKAQAQGKVPSPKPPNLGALPSLEGSGALSQAQRAKLTGYQLGAQKFSGIDDRKTTKQTLAQGGFSLLKDDPSIVKARQTLITEATAIQKASNGTLSEQQAALIAQQNLIQRELVEHGELVGHLEAVNALRAQEQAVLAEKVALQSKLTQQEKAKKVAADPNVQRNVEDLAVQRRINTAAGRLAAHSDPTAQKINKQAELAAAAERSNIRDAKAFQAARISVDKQIIAARAETASLTHLGNQHLKLYVAESRAVDDQALKAEAQRIIAERRLAKELNKRVAAEAKAQGAGIFERAQLRFGHGAGGGGGGGAAGFFGGGALQTLKYALPSAALYGGFQFISEGVKQAEELDRVFVQLEAQIGSTFKDSPEEGTKAFQELRRTVLETAKETGIAADELGRIALRVQGALKDESFVQRDGSEIANQELINNTVEAAGKLAQITGLSEEDITNDLIAASLAFKRSGQEIGDVAIQMERDFGVSAAEAVNFLGQVAPAAQSAGFGLEEFAAIAGESIVRSGRGAGALAESWSRVLPAITQNKEELIKLTATNEELNNQAFLGAVAKSDAKEILTQISNVFKDLDKTGQDSIIQLLGGRREAAAILGAFQAPDLAASILSLEDSAGALEQRFQQVGETLSVQFAQLAESVKQIFLALFDLGLDELLGGVVDALKLISSLVTPIASGFNTVNEALGGTLGKLIEVVALMKIVQAIANTSTVQNLGSLASSFGARSLYATQGTFPAASSFSQFSRNAQIAQGTAAGSGLGNAILPAGALGGTGGAAGLFTAGRVPFIGTPDPTKGAKGASAGAQAMILLAGLIAVQGAFSEQSEKIGKGADDYAKILEGATDTQIDALKKSGAEQVSWSEKLGIALFSEGIGGAFTGAGLENLPEAQRVREEAKRQAADGVTILNEMLANGTADALAQRVLGKRSELQAQGKDLNLADYLDKHLTDSNAGDIGLDTELNAGNRTEQFFTKLGEDPEAYTKELVDLAAKGDTFASAIVEHYGAVLAVSDELGGLGKGTADRLAQTHLSDEAKAKVTDLSGDVDELRGAYDAGAISQEEFLGAYDRYLDGLRGALGVSQERDLELMKLLAEGEKERENIITAGYLTKSRNYALQISDLKYGETGSGFRTVATGVDLLAQFRQLGVSESSESVQVAVDVIAAQRAEAEKAIQKVAEEDPQKALNMLQSMNGQFDIPAEARYTLLVAELEITHENWLKLLEDFNTVVGGGAQDIIASAFRFILTGQGNAEELNAKLEEAKNTLAQAASAAPGGAFAEAADQIRFIEDLQAALGGDAEALKRLAEFLGLHDVGAKGEIDKGVADKLKKDVEDANKKAEDLLNAKYAYWIALAEGDPIRQAQLKVQQAQAELNKAIAENGAGSAEAYNARAALVSANNSVKDALEANEDARSQFTAATIGDDPIVQAQFAEAAARQKISRAIYGTVDYWNAMTEWQKSIKELEKAQEDIVDAQLEFSAAQVSGDPVKAALKGIEETNLQVARAEGAAEKARAAAAQIDAWRRLSQAISDIWDAQNNLLIAQANFVGDTVLAAELGLKGAQESLRRIQEQFNAGGAGEADVINAQAALVSAQAAVRDSQLQDKLGDFEFLYDMEKITKGQLIQYLQSLKQIPDLTEEQLRDLDRRIKQLNDELGQDFQFNLPTFLNLPTLYEARRADQSGGTGNYVDNRVVTFNITGATDPMETAVTVVGLLNEGSKQNQTVRKY